MLSERFTPHVEISICGQSCPVLFTHALILEAEAATGLSSLDGTLDLLHLSAKHLRAILGAVARSAGHQPSLRQIGEAMRPAAITAYKQRLWEAWRYAMPEPEPLAHKDGENEDKPVKQQTWMEVWSNNCTLLGITDEQWLSYTPRMIQARSKQKMERIRQGELMLSKIHAATINFSMCHPEKPVSDDYGMLHPYPKPEDEEPKDVGDQIASVFGQFAAGARRINNPKKGRKLKTGIPGA